MVRGRDRVSGKARESIAVVGFKITIGKHLLGMTQEELILPSDKRWTRPPCSALSSPTSYEETVHLRDLRVSGELEENSEQTDPESVPFGSQALQMTEHISVRSTKATHPVEPHTPHGVCDMASPHPHQGQFRMTASLRRAGHDLETAKNVFFFYVFWYKHCFHENFYL